MPALCSSLPGDCLLDPPEQTLPLPVDAPGVSYNLDRQCQQAFGEEFSLCPDTPEDQTCSQLWCREEGQPHCTTRNGSLPWADGTLCWAGAGAVAGTNTTCQGGVCAAVTDQQKREVLYVQLKSEVYIHLGWSH